MKNKAHFVKQLCGLKGLDPESEEAKDLYALKILDLLMEIKKYGPVIVTEEERRKRRRRKKHLQSLLAAVVRVNCCYYNNNGSIT